MSARRPYNPGAKGPVRLPSIASEPGLGGCAKRSTSSLHELATQSSSRGSPRASVRQAGVPAPRLQLLLTCQPGLAACGLRLETLRKDKVAILRMRHCDSANQLERASHGGGWLRLAPAGKGARRLAGALFMHQRQAGAEPPDARKKETWRGYKFVGRPRGLGGPKADRHRSTDRHRSLERTR